MNTKINPLFVFFLSFLFLIMSTNGNAQEQNKGKIAILYCICSIRHDFYGGCRDSAEGGTLLSC